MNWVAWLGDPWASELQQRAFVEGLLMGATCGALGCFVLVRGLAFLGESVAHTVVLGVILAFLAGLPVALGAAAVAALTVALTGVIQTDRRYSVDTAMGVLLPSLFGLGVVLISASSGYRAKLEETLFGSILGVTWGDVALAGVAAAVTVGVLAVAGRPLVRVAFDRTFARSQGAPLLLLDLLLLGVVTLAAVIALRAVGNVLLTAMLLAPAATARLVTIRIWPMIAVASILGAASATVGLYLSWYVDVAAGAAIVLTAATAFAVTAIAVRVPLPRRAPPPRTPAEA